MLVELGIFSWLLMVFIPYQIKFILSIICMRRRVTKRNRYECDVQNGWHRIEGGAHGEHKMAHGLLPIATHSAHWLAYPQFADAVARFLEREGSGINNYMEHLEGLSPFRV